MKFEIVEHLHPTAECILLLNRHCSELPDLPSTLRAETERICDKFDIPLCALMPSIEPFVQVEDYILQHLTALGNQERTIFACAEGTFANLAWGMYFLDQEGVVLERLSGDELLQELRHLLCIALNCSMQALEPVRSAQALSSFLEAYPCSVSTKWACSVVWQNPVEYQNRYHQVIQEATALFQERAPSLDPILNQVIPEIHELITSDEKYHILHCLPPNSENRKEILVYPFIMRYNSLSVLWDHSRPGNEELPDQGESLLLAGAFYPLLIRLIEQYRNNSEFLASGTNAMGDIRRIEILKALKKRPMCNYELAEFLNLSPGTISHHMRYLLQEDFVSIRKRGSRVDYSLNSQTLQALLESIQAALL